VRAVAATPDSLRHVGAAPYTSVDTLVVMDRAICDLADRRFVQHLDAPAQLHLLASLIAQAESWVAEQVALARGDGAAWGEIGRLLGTTATAARQRWARQARPPAQPGTPARCGPKDRP